MNITARAELGRDPIEKYVKVQTVKYLARLHYQNLNPLLKEAFILCKKLDSEGIYSWYTYAKNISSELGISSDEIEYCDNFKVAKILNPKIKKGAQSIKKSPEKKEYVLRVK